MASSYRLVAFSAVAAKVNAEYEALSADGYRVLAVASRPVPRQDNYEPSDEVRMVFEGFVAFLDPGSAQEGLPNGADHNCQHGRVPCKPAPRNRAKANNDGGDDEALSGVHEALRIFARG